jgi:hypothetical protein
MRLLAQLMTFAVRHQSKQYAFHVGTFTKLHVKPSSVTCDVVLSSNFHKLSFQTAEIMTGKETEQKAKT